MFAKLKKQPNENCVISLTCTLNIRFTWGRMRKCQKKSKHKFLDEFQYLGENNIPPLPTKTEYIYIQLHVLNKQFSPYHVQSWHENGKVLPRFLQGSAAKWEGKGVEEKGERWKGGGSKCAWQASRSPTMDFHSHLTFNTCRGKLTGEAHPPLAHRDLLVERTPLRVPGFSGEKQV